MYDNEYQEKFGQALGVIINLELENANLKKEFKLLQDKYDILLEVKNHL
jgi:hypothetical protein